MSPDTRHEAAIEALTERFAGMLDEWERTKALVGIRERAGRLARAAYEAALGGERPDTEGREESLRSELAMILRGHSSLSDGDWAAIGRFIERVARSAPALGGEGEPDDGVLRVLEMDLDTLMLAFGATASVSGTCSLPTSALRPIVKHTLAGLKTVRAALAGQPEPKDCDECGGSGSVRIDSPGLESYGVEPEREDCDACDGTGKLAGQPEDEEKQKALAARFIGAALLDDTSAQDGELLTEVERVRDALKHWWRKEKDRREILAEAVQEALRVAHDHNLTGDARLHALADGLRAALRRSQGRASDRERSLARTPQDVLDSDAPKQGIRVQWAHPADIKPGEKALHSMLNAFRRVAAIRPFGEHGGYEIQWEGDEEFFTVDQELLLVVLDSDVRGER